MKHEEEGEFLRFFFFDLGLHFAREQQKKDIYSGSLFLSGLIMFSSPTELTEF